MRLPVEDSHIRSAVGLSVLSVFVLVLNGLVAVSIMAAFVRMVVGDVCCDGMGV